VRVSAVSSPSRSRFSGRFDEVAYPLNGRHSQGILCPRTERGLGYPVRSTRSSHFIFFPEVDVASLSLAVRRFVRDEEGAALAEYGILVAFIAIVAITAVTFFGSKISAKFSALATSFT